MDFGRRIRVLFIFLFVFFAIVVIRLIWVQIVQHRFFQEKSLEQRTRIINLASSRGDILDRNGKILATSIDTYSVFTQNNGFSWVARRLPLPEAEKLRESNRAVLFC